MHSPFIGGDYVLSKLKKDFESYSEIDSELISVGNLNVNIDIGFASDYMKCVSSLICSCQSPKEVFIGTVFIPIYLTYLFLPFRIWSFIF